MIKRIIFFLLIFDFILACLLLLAGIHQVDLGSTVMSIMTLASKHFSDYKLAIPNIPTIPNVGEVLGIAPLDAVITFLNGLVGFLNFLISIVNTFIQIWQFFIFFVGAIFEYIANANDFVWDFPFIHF